MVCEDQSWASGALTVDCCSWALSSLGQGIREGASGAAGLSPPPQPDLTPNRLYSLEGLVYCRQESELRSSEQTLLSPHSASLSAGRSATSYAMPSTYQEAS